VETGGAGVAADGLATGLKNSAGKPITWTRLNSRKAFTAIFPASVTSQAVLRPNHSRGLQEGNESEHGNQEICPFWAAFRSENGEAGSEHP
jgi:hypothetical protein